MPVGDEGSEKTSRRPLALSFIIVSFSGEISELVAKVSVIVTDGASIAGSQKRCEVNISGGRAGVESGTYAVKAVKAVNQYPAHMLR